MFRNTSPGDVIDTVHTRISQLDDHPSALRCKGDGSHLKVRQVDFCWGDFFSEEQMEMYTTIGGTPFLDGDYTVFGEIVQGMEIIDIIAAREVAPGSNRPIEDIAMEVSIIE